MIVTLLTDFGTADYFVGAMKGVILTRDPRIRIVDITHHVPPHDSDTAAFLLSAVYRDFPAGTVHLVVVDPGVGSERRSIAIRAGDFYFVGPDNGVFDLVLAREKSKARAIENPALRRSTVSSTFHGRDIFAPTAAALSAGLPFTDVGRLIQPMRSGSPPSVAPTEEEGFEGRILHIDRFGNCVTSLRAGDLPGGPGEYRFVGSGWSIDEVRTYYAQGTGERPFLIEGSAGYLEISLDRGSAAALLGIAPRDRVHAIRRE